MKLSRLFSLVLAGLSLGGAAFAQDKAPTEADYYPISAFKVPDDVNLEAGGLQWYQGKLAVSTRRGDIYLVENALDADVSKAKFSLFARGLHEVLGLTERDGWLYATQRCEVSRLKDENNDGKADIVETVCDKWSINGDYHEYAFGSKFDKDGNIWVVLCLTGSFTSNVPYRGWCIRVSPDGKMTPTCSGVRSPGGIGFNSLGEVFYTDNQGPWNGACGLKHLEPGKFVGNPSGFGWYDLPEVKSVMGKKPEEPKSGSRMMVEAKKIPELNPTAVFFPYPKMGKSASGIGCDTLGGKFGPFQNQLFVGDQSDSTVMRVYLEKVNGHYQGVCFPFLQGIGSGTLSVQFHEDGSLFVGGTNRGWGSRGPKPYSLDRIRWTGKVPFEIHEMHAKSDGFELTFTHPIDPASATDPKGYDLSTYTYIYQSSYGSPEVDHTKPTIESITVADNKKSLRLKIAGLQEGHVHELHCNGIKSEAGLPLLHKSAYYTLNYIPQP